jgi:hypothetical protein
MPKHGVAFHTAFDNETFVIGSLSNTIAIYLLSKETANAHCKTPAPPPHLGKRANRHLSTAKKKLLIIDTHPIEFGKSHSKPMLHDQTQINPDPEAKMPGFQTQAMCYYANPRVF